MTEALVRLVDIVQRFGNETALDHVSLDIPKGAFTVLLGPSGSGKSTLLNVIGGFLQPQAGEILIAGRDMRGVPPARRPTTTVFQDYALFPHMSVGDNVGFGLRMRGMPRQKRDERAREALALVGLADAFARKPHQLSGGQRQRVALARALVVDPLVLLLDEPLGALDLKLRRQMQDELVELQKRIGTTFVHVTHDQEEAMALADTLVVMNRGRIEDQGPPERVYARPATFFTAGFMGEITHFEGTVSTPGRADTPLGAIPVSKELASGTRIRIAIRPENLILGKDTGDIPLGELQLREIVFQGPSKRLLGSIGALDSPVAAIVRQPADAVVAVGDRLPVSVAGEHLLVYPA